MRANIALLASYHMQALQFARIGQRVVAGHLGEKYRLHIVLWCWAAGLAWRGGFSCRSRRLPACRPSLPLATGNTHRRS